MTAEARREDVIVAALGVAQARSWIEAHPEDGTASWSLEAAEDDLNLALRRFTDARVAPRRPILSPAAPSLREATREACRREQEAREKAAREARQRLEIQRLRADLRRGLGLEPERPPYLYDAEKKRERRPRPYSAVRLCGIPDCYCPGYAHP